jgi:protein O-GlcNAc transferase
MNRKDRRAAGSRGKGADHSSSAMTPNFPTELSLLVSTALRFHQAGQLAEAEQHYRRILALDPNQIDCLHNLGLIAHHFGQHESAITLMGKAIALNDRVPDFHNNIGVAQCALGRQDQAVIHFRKALGLNPSFAEAHNNLGNALKDRGQLDEAVKHFQRALALKPGFAQAHNSLGNALKDQGKLDAAVAHCQQALGLMPNYAEARNNLGNALQDQGKLDEAAAQYERALALRPNFAEAHNNLGTVLQKQGQLHEAAAQHRRALELKPDYVEALGNLGNALKDLGQLDGAIDAFGHAFRLRPGHVEAFGQLVHLRQHACDWTDFEADQQRLLEIVRERKGRIPPFLLLASPATPAEQLLCSQEWAKGVKRELADPASFRHARDGRSDKIRLGYLSADFHDHPMSYLMAELFERHDRSNFVVSAYSYGLDDRGDMRRRLTQAFDRFVDIRPLPHRQAAQRIYDDGIDILIDLKGFTTHGRDEIAAYRPAPVQVNCLGFAGTMGADYLDYIIADPVVAPLGDQLFYAEKLVHLPDCYMARDTTREIAEPMPSRSDCGLPAEGFVFCSFNNSFKFTPAFFEIWMRLLKAMPDGVLWLYKSNESMATNLRREAAARGVDPERLIFAPRKPLPEHLARLRQADLFLDTLPCNAHTTASDALWAGVPVLTCIGRTFAARVAASLLHAAGMPDLVTSSPEEYEALALKLATEREQLGNYRRYLEANRRTMSLFDMGRFTRNIETAYRGMWETWSRHS